MTLHIYGLLLGLGICVGWVVAEKKATKESRELLSGAILWMFGGGVVGARIYHLVTDWQLYHGASVVDLVAVWRGGLGIYGAIVGAVLGGVAYLCVKKQLTGKNVLTMFDLFGIGLPIGQAIGRWGNYFNGELYGLPTNLPWGIQVPEAVRPMMFQSFTKFHPLFLYESLSMFILWVYLWKQTGNTRQARLRIGTGQVFSVYVIAYGTVRFFLDFLRIDKALFYGIPIGQAVSLLAVAIGVVFLAKNRKKSVIME